MLLRDGGVIATDTTPSSTSCAGSARNADQYSIDLEARERERTGSPTLKVGYNRVHGYYIEITQAQSAAAPADTSAAKR